MTKDGVASTLIKSFLDGIYNENTAKMMKSSKNKDYTRHGNPRRVHYTENSLYLYETYALAHRIADDAFLVNLDELNGHNLGTYVTALRSWFSKNIKAHFITVSADAFSYAGLRWDDLHKYVVEFKPIKKYTYPVVKRPRPNKPYPDYETIYVPGKKTLYGLFTEDGSERAAWFREHVRNGSVLINVGGRSYLSEHNDAVLPSAWYGQGRNIEVSVYSREFSSITAIHEARRTYANTGSFDQPELFEPPQDVPSIGPFIFRSVKLSKKEVTAEKTLHRVTLSSANPLIQLKYKGIYSDSYRGSARFVSSKMFVDENGVYVSGVVTDRLYQKLRLPKGWHKVDVLPELGRYTVAGDHIPAGLRHAKVDADVPSV